MAYHGLSLLLPLLLSGLFLGNLDKVKFNRRLTSEYGNGDTQLAFFVVHLIHITVKSGEGTVNNANFFTALKAELGTRAILACLHT